jgi:hypothetical protein
MSNTKKCEGFIMKLFKFVLFSLLLVSFSTKLHSETLKPHDEMVTDALKFLSTQQQADGSVNAYGYDRTGCASVSAMSGLAWLFGGSDLKSGPHKDNLKRVTQYFLQRAW